MRLLLLGGYRFLGRAIVDAALACGHTVTVYNRGHQPVPAGVERIVGDRADPAALASGRWDAAIDTSGQSPRHVAAACAALGGRVAHYTFVSSISAYAEPLMRGADENAPLAVLAAGVDPDDIRDAVNYGARKAACEDATWAAFPGRDLLIRPGFIVGPHDYSHRFSSWVERAAYDGPLLVPEGADAIAVQAIDVRDLAAWIVRMVERGATGDYNATSPPFTLAELARTCVAVAGPHATIVPVPVQVLSAAGVEPWTDLPFWTPTEDDAIVHVGVERALAAGLTLRPLADTVAATAAWLRSPERGELPHFLNRERELGIIASLAGESAGGNGPA